MDSVPSERQWRGPAKRGGGCEAAIREAPAAGGALPREIFTSSEIQKRCGGQDLIYRINSFFLFWLKMSFRQEEEEEEEEGGRGGDGGGVEVATAPGTAERKEEEKEESSNNSDGTRGGGVWRGGVWEVVRRGEGGTKENKNGL